MSLSKISVIMLTYNRENLVGRAIESILYQSFSNFEFIIVDNGSVDRSGAIADEYALMDSRISVIHCDRGNIGSGRNAGLAVAKGEYITFVDDDDYADPDFLDFLFNLAVLNSADISVCGAYDKVFDVKRIMTAEEALIELLWRRHYNMAFPTKMFNRKLAKKIYFSETDKYDDISQMYKLIAKANCIAYHGIPKYTFYRHESNNSAWTSDHSLMTDEILAEYLRVYRERTEWLFKVFPNNAEMWQYFEWSFMISMVDKIKRLGIKGCSDKLEKMSSELKKNSKEFYYGKYTQNFEKEWMEKYLL